MASAGSRVTWHLKGEEVAICNCAWGCPCQFNALPTTGRCESLIAYLVHEGQFGPIPLSGVRFAQIVSFPGAVHKGNGTRRFILDERMTPDQRNALRELESGQQGGTYFEIFASVCPHTLEPMIAPLDVQIERDKRLATIRIPGVAEAQIEPIKNAVTGEEHRARIELPNGFEYKVAEMGNSVSWKVTGAGDTLTMEHQNTYAQLNEFHWSNA
jgi:hypothetical protein